MKNKWKFEVLRTALALGISLLVLFLIILFVSKEPANALRLLFLGPVSSFKAFSNVIVMMIPLMFTGVGTCIIFSSDSINLSSEAAFYMGGVVAAAIGLFVKLPVFIIAPLAMLCAAVTGGIITGIPGYLKMKTNSDEMVVSLMLNYIMLYFGLFILIYAMKDYTITGLASWKLPANLELPKLVPNTRIHLGLILAILAVAISYFAMYKTPWGLKVRITGSNSDFAKFAGVNVAFTALSTQVLGGIWAGLGGGVELLGLYKRFTWQVSPNYGWDGVLLATMARNNPKYIPLAAFFLAYLRIGSDIMARGSDVPQEVLRIVQGIIIVLIVAKKLTSRIEKRSLYAQAKKTVNAQGSVESK